GEEDAQRDRDEREAKEGTGNHRPILATPLAAPAGWGWERLPWPGAAPDPGSDPAGVDPATAVVTDGLDLVDRVVRETEILVRLGHGGLRRGLPLAHHLSLLEAGVRTEESRLLLLPQGRRGPGEHLPGESGDRVQTDVPGHRVLLPPRPVRPGRRRHGTGAAFPSRSLRRGATTGRSISQGPGPGRPSRAGLPDRTGPPPS